MFSPFLYQNGEVRLVIQIPCFNEAETLPTTLGDLPRAVNGFDDVLWVVIDDGSSDRTAEIAEAHGADMVVQLANNKGLAVAFQAGLDASLQLGADVIVNTDADNQYAASDIPRLVEPIRNGDADLVVGTRDIANHEEFSLLKKWLQRVGSWVVRQASATRFRRHLRIQGLLQRSGSPSQRRLAVHIHTRKPHPGWPLQPKSRRCAHRSKSNYSPVAPISLKTPVRSKVSRNYLPGIRHA